jgi:hypothetical protein
MKRAEIVLPEELRQKADRVIALFRACTNGDHLSLKLRFVALGAEGEISKSPLRACAPMGPDDVDALAEQLLEQVVLLRAGAEIWRERLSKEEGSCD